MKKLITIILAMIMTFFSAPNQGADQPPVTAEKSPQTSITVQVEQVPEESEKLAETAFVSEVTEVETKVEGQKKKHSQFKKRSRKNAPRSRKKLLPKRKKTPSNVSTRATKALWNTSHKSVLSRIRLRMTYPPRSITDR